MSTTKFPSRATGTSQFQQRRSFKMSAPPAAPAHSCKVILSSAIAKKLLEEVTAGIKALEQPPRLHGFLANADPAARQYAEWTQKTCTDK